MKRMNGQQTIRNVQGKEIDLWEYFHLIWKKLWIIILITAVTSAVGYYYSEKNNVPFYQTSTRVLIGEDAGSMNTLMVMVKDPLVLERVKEELGLDISAGSLAGKIEVAQLEDSQVIELLVTDSDPEQAAAIANTTAEMFKSEVASILEVTEIRLLAPAPDNTAPIGGSGNKLLIVAIFFGLITSVGLIFLMDSLDRSVRNTRDIEEMFDITVLGSVSNMKKVRFSNKEFKKKQKEMKLRSEAIGSK